MRRRRTDVFKNRQNFSDWSMTPLQHQHGIVTPNGLIYERHHNGTPDIDPAKHRLVIHGMVKQPLEVHDGRSAALSRPCRSSISWSARATVSPTGSRPHPRPCSRRTGSCRARNGPVSRFPGCSDEAGSAPGAKWLVFEGADGAAHTRSLPLKKVLDDCLHRLCAERRNAARRARLPAAPVRTGLGRQRKRQMAAAHQGRR